MTIDEFGDMLSPNWRSGIPERQQKFCDSLSQN